MSMAGLVVWQGCKEKALFSAESASHLHMHESEDCLNSVSWIDEIKIDIFIYVRRVIYMEQEKKMHHTIKNVSQSRNMVALASLVFCCI